jgi:broad specificity polyphosphatase/5'/3'-nucleotidase SurE
LQPTIFDNFEVKISAFDYAFFSYSISYSDNNIAQQVGRKDLLITNTNINIPKMRIHSFNAGIRLFMVFTKSLKEMLKFDFNPDKINFLYLYTNYQKHEIPDLDNKGFWVLEEWHRLFCQKTSNSQPITAILPKEIISILKPSNLSINLLILI